MSTDVYKPRKEVKLVDKVYPYRVTPTVHMRLKAEIKSDEKQIGKNSALFTYIIYIFMSDR